MGSFCVVVNTNRREWIDPWYFGVSAKIPWYASVDEHGANPLFYAIAYLCSGERSEDYISGQWGGDPVVFADEQNEARDGRDYGVIMDSPDHRNLYGLAQGTFRDISKEVTREIAVDEPMFLISLFRRAVSRCESEAWPTWGREILELYDEATDDGEWLREHLERAAQYELEWSKDQWDSLIARLRHYHAKPH
jgi:hypothetical protein